MGKRQTTLFWNFDKKQTGWSDQTNSTLQQLAEKTTVQFNLMYFIYIYVNNLIEIISGTCKYILVNDHFKAGNFSIRNVIIVKFSHFTILVTMTTMQEALNFILTIICLFFSSVSQFLPCYALSYHRHQSWTNLRCCVQFKQNWIWNRNVYWYVFILDTKW